MTATNQNFEMEAGDNVVIRGTIKGADGAEHQVANHTGKFILTGTPGDEPIVEYDESDNNFNPGSPEADQIEVELSSGDTESLGAGTEEGNQYYYEIELTSPAGSDYTVTKGWITIYESY